MVALVGIDFTKDGKQFGNLEFPHSVHRSAYGKIQIPVILVKNGVGANVLLSAGVHGDEYEGQFTLRKLAIEINPDDVTGSILILPTANLPAAEVASRTSPIDEGNLNRLFPGDPEGSITQQIAFSIEHELLAKCDYAFDIHSGGSSLMYEAIGMMTETGEVDDDKCRLGLLMALGISVGSQFPTGTNAVDGSLDGAMIRQNVIGVSAEFGGAGTTNRSLLAVCRTCINNALHHTGVLKHDDWVQEPELFELFDAFDHDCYIHASKHGLFEPEFDLGDNVNKDDVAGRFYDYYDLTLPPNILRFPVSGRVLCRRAMPLSSRGDCLVQLGKPVTRN